MGIFDRFGEKVAALRRRLQLQTFGPGARALGQEIISDVQAALAEVSQLVETVKSVPQGQRAIQVRNLFMSIRDYTHNVAPFIKGINGSGQDLCHAIDIVLTGYIAALQGFDDACDEMAVYFPGSVSVPVAKETNGSSDVSHDCDEKVRDEFIHLNERLHATTEQMIGQISDHVVEQMVAGMLTSMRKALVLAIYQCEQMKPRIR